MVAKSVARPAGTHIRLILVHTNQGPNPPEQLPDHTAENLARYLDRDDHDPVSYHVLEDDDSEVIYLPDERQSFSALRANPISLNICLTGYAEWDRAEWLRHPQMLKRGAVRVRRWCAKHNLPAVKLTPGEIAAGRWGLGGHGDWTFAEKIRNPRARDSHTDPGPHFPWDVFVGYVAGDIPVGRRDAVLENHRVSGSGVLPLLCPVGKASAVTARAWISAMVDGPGPGRVRFWFQGDAGGVSDMKRDIGFRDGRSDRTVVDVPDGATMVRVQYEFFTGGTIALETLPK